MSCGIAQWLCDAAGNVVESAADDSLNAVGKAVANGVADLVATLSTAWLDVPTPSLVESGNRPSGGQSPSDAVAFIQESVLWYSLGLAVLCLIVAGGRMAWDSSRGQQHLREIMRGLLTLALVLFRRDEGRHYR